MGMTYGHDVITIAGQGMAGANDETLYEVICAEGRVLVTLDHHFG
jgi:hypothetical protein